VEITVADALKIGGLKQCRLLAGTRNLGNKILHIDTMEVPDIRPWLRRNELLVTTGYSIRDDPLALTRLIESLAEVGAAGLAIKPTRFIGKLPGSTIELAEKLGVPLIEVPADVPFIEITHPLMQAILGRQASRLEYSETVHRALLRVTLEGRGCDSIASVLQSLLKCEVIIYNSDFEILAIADAGRVVLSAEQCAYLVKLVGTTRTRLGELPWQYCCRPVRVKDRTLGYVAVSERYKQLNDMELIALEHACTTVALEIAKQEAVVETARRLEIGFFDELVDGTIRLKETADRRARDFGWPVGCDYCVLFVAAEGLSSGITIRSEPLLRAAQAAISKRLRCKGGCSPPVLARTDSLVCIIPVSSRSTEDGLSAAGELRQALKRHVKGIKVSVGVSAEYCEILDLPRAYREAQRAAQMSRIFEGGDCITHISDVAVLNLLLDEIDLSKLGDFRDRMLNPLMALSPGGDILIRTLEAFIACSGSHVDTAHRLYIHRNTLAYRLKRIEQILGHSLRDQPYLMSLCVAVRLHRFFESINNGASAPFR
jgi:purine catabolism regulator